MNRSRQVTGINGHYKRVTPVETYRHGPDRTRINQLLRERRKRFTRFDYIDVSPEARKVIDSLRDRSAEGTVSAILNRIVIEWAESNTGINTHIRRGNFTNDFAQ